MGQRIEGQCHCGNLRFRLDTERPLEVRACQCRFCRAHGAACASDPAGRALIEINDESLLSRYRFARRTADFLICRRCGGYLGALLETPAGAFATLNLRNATEIELPPVEPVDYDSESAEERVRRRRERWTPAVLA